VIRACCQDPRAVWAKCCSSDNVLVGKEAMRAPEAASQSLALWSALAVRIRAPPGLNAARETQS